MDRLIAAGERFGRSVAKVVWWTVSLQLPARLRERAKSMSTETPSPSAVVADESVAERLRYFEDLYRPTEDPWRYENNPFEEMKYRQTLSLLPEGPIANALELACAEGHFTRLLAARVDHLVAADISPTAVARARTRCAGLPNVEFRVLDLVSDALPRDLDLLVCSEALYFTPREDLPRIAAKFAAALKANGLLLMANALTIADERDHTGFDWGSGFGAKTISDAFAASEGFALETELRTPLYRIHVFRRVANGGGTRAKPEVIEAPLGALPVGVERTAIWGGAVCTRAEAEQQAPASQVPILMYHNIADDGNPQLSRYRVSPADFQQQMRHLRRLGYHSITVADWANRIASGTPVPGRPVIITFDDACKNFITHAAPILEAADFRATIFVVTGKVGGTADWDAAWPPLIDLMDWDDLRNLAQRGFELASHTVTHANLGLLPDEAIVSDSIAARATLREHLGTDVTDIAFPFGVHDDRVRAALARGGYRVGLADDGIRFSSLGDDLMCLPRVGISGHSDLGTFARRLETPDRSVTLCITSANRPDLLRRTLTSLLAANAASFQEIFIIDDLASEACAAVVRDVCPTANFLLNETRLGHHRSLDRLYSHVRTPFIFQCEDDWEFDPVPIVYDCLEALLAIPDASGVFVRVKEELSPVGLQAMEGSELREIEGCQYLLPSHDILPPGSDASIGTAFGLSPNLMRRSLWEEHGPYANFPTEADIMRHMKAQRLRCILRLNGTCHHIGDERHVIDPFQTPMIPNEVR
jgi:peptidoglycan/xylan/chitin deacetylase (PgdA/CDA1 family)/SAM-dependent methyltransferase